MRSSPRVVPALILTLAALLAVGCASSGGGEYDAPEAATTSKRDARTEHDPLHSLSLMRQGANFMQQGDYEKALDAFHRADRSAPGNATVHNMMGLCHLRMEQLDQALASFSRALELVPSFTDARNNRGAAYLALGQYHLAEVDFTAVLSDTAYQHRWEVFYNLGMTYLRRGQMEAAEENFNRAVTAPAPVFEAFLRLAEIEQQQGNLSIAVDLLEEARIKFPARVEASLHLGRLLTQLDRGDEAERYLREVITAAPSSTWAEEASELLEDS